MADLSRRNFLFARFRGSAAKDEPRAIEKPAAVLPGVRTPPSPNLRTLPVLRPPGAITEELFLSKCTKCDDCARACPYGAIRKAPPQLRLAAFTPMIDPAQAACHLCPDTPCITACVTGALVKGLPAKIGLARIDPTTCLAHQGSFCTTCSEKCPVKGAIAVQNGRPKIDPSLCAGCGLCLEHCPAPHNAIALMPLLQRPAAPATVAR